MLISNTAPRSLKRLVGTSLVAFLASTAAAIACPAVLPGVATGEVFCNAAGSLPAPWVGLGDQLRIANTEGSTGTLTLSAGDKISLSPGTDADPGLAAPHAVLGRRLGSDGTLTIDGAGAELLLHTQGAFASMHLGRDGGDGTAIVSDGGAIRMLSDIDLGFGSSLSRAGIALGRAGVGSLGELSLDAGMIDIDVVGDSKIWIGRDGATGNLAAANGSTISLKSTVVGSYSEIQVGGNSSSTGFGAMSVDASDVSLSSGDGGAGFYVGRGTSSVGTASFDNGASLSLTSNSYAQITLGDGAGAFGALSFNGGSTATVHSGDTFLDIGRDPGSVGIVTITGGSTVTLTADDPNEADVYVGAAFADFGRPIAGNGTLLVSGAGSVLSLTSSVVVGALNGVSTGHMTVADGAVVTAETVWVGVGGRLDGDGGFVLADIVVEGGLLAPGSSPGTMTIGGDLTLTAGGVLEMEVNGAGLGEYDILNVGGALDLSAGVTRFVFDPDFLAQVEADPALMPLLTSFFPVQDAAELSAVAYGGVSAGRSPFLLTFDTGGALAGISFAASVPLPATLPSLLAAFGALAFLRRREGRRRGAAKASFCGSNAALSVRHLGPTR
jgi:T5SS/PEP-CTERM-associated repeat protein